MLPGEAGMESEAQVQSCLSANVWVVTGECHLIEYNHNTVLIGDALKMQPGPDCHTPVLQSRQCCCSEETISCSRPDWLHCSLLMELAAAATKICSQFRVETAVKPGWCICPLISGGGAG